MPNRIMSESGEKEAIDGLPIDAALDDALRRNLRTVLARHRKKSPDILFDVPLDAFRIVLKQEAEALRNERR
jgi:hypothetical protein